MSVKRKADKHRRWYLDETTVEKIDENDKKFFRKLGEKSRSRLLMNRRNSAIMTQAENQKIIHEFGEKRSLRRSGSFISLIKEELGSIKNKLPEVLNQENDPKNTALNYIRDQYTQSRKLSYSRTTTWFDKVRLFDDLYLNSYNHINRLLTIPGLNTRDSLHDKTLFVRKSLPNHDHWISSHKPEISRKTRDVLIIDYFGGVEKLAQEILAANNSDDNSYLGLLNNKAAVLMAAEKRQCVIDEVIMKLALLREKKIIAIQPIVKNQRNKSRPTIVPKVVQEVKNKSKSIKPTKDHHQKPLNFKSSHTKATLSKYPDKSIKPSIKHEKSDQSDSLTLKKCNFMAKAATEALESQSSSTNMIVNVNIEYRARQPSTRQSVRSNNNVPSNIDKIANMPELARSGKIVIKKDSRYDKKTVAQNQSKNQNVKESQVKDKVENVQESMVFDNLRSDIQSNGIPTPVHEVAYIHSLSVTKNKGEAYIKDKFAIKDILTSDICTQNRPVAINSIFTGLTVQPKNSRFASKIDVSEPSVISGLYIRAIIAAPEPLEMDTLPTDTDNSASACGIMPLMRNVALIFDKILLTGQEIRENINISDHDDRSLRGQVRKMLAVQKSISIMKNLGGLEH